MPCFSAFVFKHLPPIEPGKGVRAYVIGFMFTSPKQAGNSLYAVAEGEANSQCFECLTEGERELERKTRSTDGKVNSLTDALI